MKAYVFFAALFSSLAVSESFLACSVPQSRRRIRTVVPGIPGDIDDLRRDREENDFLAVAQGLGLVNDKDVERGRELERQKDRKPVGSSSKFGDWMGGLMVGTPFSPEAVDEEDDDLLVRLARRMEERRDEQAADAASASAAEESSATGSWDAAGGSTSRESGSRLDSTIGGFFADSSPEGEAPRKRRKRKDGSSSSD